MESRVRWRITLDELAHICRVPAGDIEYWARLGALGKRYVETRDQGFGRHITRVAAQRAVIMSRLLRAGIRAEDAAEISAEHVVGDVTPLTFHEGHVTISVDRSDLP